MNKREIVISVCGAVNASKSSCCSVLKYGELDNGNGLARNKIAKHPHEIKYGRTSDINNIYVKVKDSNKIITFVDLCGHRKYLKTTVRGLASEFIDYCMLMVAGNSGISRITRQHLSLALMLKIPLFVVISKIDITPPNILTKTLKSLVKILENKNTAKKKCVLITKRKKNNIEELNFEFYNRPLKICPVFFISNVTGKNVNILRDFVSNLQKSKIKLKKYKLLQKNKNSTFIISDTYKVVGLSGVVIAGTVRCGHIKQNDKLFLGPIEGTFKEVIVKSLHDNFRNYIEELFQNESGCLNIKYTNSKFFLKQSTIKRGMILIKKPNCVKEFDAEIRILHHPTTIKKLYEPVVHCNNVRQTVILTNIKNKKYLRTGDTSIVKLQFKFRPEYVEKGSNIVLREAKMKAMGKILKIYYI